MPGSSCVTTADPSVRHQALIWTLRKGEEKIISFTLLFQLWTTPITKNLCNFFWDSTTGIIGRISSNLICLMKSLDTWLYFQNNACNSELCLFLFYSFSLVQNMIFVCSKIKCKVTKEAALWLLWVCFHTALGLALLFAILFLFQ